VHHSAGFAKKQFENAANLALNARNHVEFAIGVNAGQNQTMSNNDIERFGNQLQTRKKELEQQNLLSAEARDTVALDQQSVGRLSRMDAMQGQAMAQAQERQRTKELMRIEQALTRILNDDFGYCEDCGDQISERRLSVDPAALFCLKCAQANER